MRKLLTSVLALIVSLFVGGLVAQLLAVETDAHEEWIVVFVATILVAAIVTIVFFIVQLASGTAEAAGAAMRVLLAIFIVLVVGLLIWTVWVDGIDKAGNDLPIVAGLALPGIAIIIVQWLIVRWRTPHAGVPRFGRGEGS